MSRTEAEFAALGDPALAQLARADDPSAFAELWRRHAGAGNMAARQFAAIADPQDIVSEAYLRIFRAMQGGGGPHEAFRPYLYRTIRNIAMDWRARGSSVPLDETAELIDATPSLESEVLDNTITARAFEQLPERWRAVLWYLEVEGMSPTEAAPILGLSPNATSVLAGRAHEGFKKAWLQAHVNDRSVPVECRWTTERMGGYVRRGLSRRSRDRFDRHLDECERCALLAHEIRDLGGQLASVLLPVTLGSAAGSLLLLQLRDHAASTVAASVTPLAVPVGTLAVRGAAAVLIASGALLAPAAVEQQPQSPPAAAGEPTSSEPSPASGSDPLGAVTEQPQSPDSPTSPVVEPVIEPVVTPTVEPASVVATPPTPTPSQPVDDPALLGLSLSLLSGTVTVEAEVDLDPVTELVDAVLPGMSLPGLSILGG